MNSENVTTEKPVVEETSNKLTGNQWLTLCGIICVHFSSGVCFSVQAPFYPKEAESRGATATEYGLVFAIFELTGFAASPLLGRYLHILGVKTTLNVGMLLTAISVICFGLLEYVQAHAAFIVLSLILRITEAIGSTAAVVSAYSIIVTIFPENIATTFATLESVFGVGILVGPTAGALLFSVGGFKLPFIVVGFTVIVADIFVLLVLPPVHERDSTTAGSVKVWDVLKIPSVQIVTVNVIVASISVSFLTAILEPHIRKFELSPLLTGFMFVINGGAYGITAPFIGRICDKWLPPRTVLCLGPPMIIAGYIFLGPTPFLGIPNTITFCIIGLLLQGTGGSLSVVPTMIDLISSSVEAGYPNDVPTFGVISGLWFSAFALGSFIGPSTSGFLYDLVGFQYATLFVIALNFAMFCGLNIFIGIQKRYFCCKKQKFEVNP